MQSAEVAESAERIRSAISSLDVSNAGLVVLLTPHAQRDEDDMGYGFHRNGRGSLAQFGRPDIAVSGSLDEVASQQLGARSGWGTRSAPLDYGAVVPLATRDWGPAIAVASFADLTIDDRPALDAIYEVARDYAGAIAAIAADRDVAVIASVNGCAGLSPRAPLTETAEAIDGEEWLLETLASDLGGLGEWKGALERVWRGGSCGIGPLEVLGELFVGRKARVLAHEAPVGVGYLVAEVV